MRVAHRYPASARACAIAPAPLTDRNSGSPVALIRRFDREPTGRLLYVSAATLLGAESSDPQEHAYTEIVDAIRQYGVRVQKDIEELWRRIAFSILITNVDDHLHNHGFLHETRDLSHESKRFSRLPPIAESLVRERLPSSKRSRKPCRSGEPWRSG
ncbi:MAG: HipA domain-containing protein [Gammaproteobacteria bacterium]